MRIRSYRSKHSIWMALLMMSVAFACKKSSKDSAPAPDDIPKVETNPDPKIDPKTDPEPDADDQEDLALATRLLGTLADSCRAAGAVWNGQCSCPASNAGPQIFDADSGTCRAQDLMNRACLDIAETAMDGCLFNSARNGNMRLVLKVSPEDRESVRSFIGATTKISMNLPAEQAEYPGGNLNVMVGTRLGRTQDVLERYYYGDLYPSAHQIDPGLAALYIPTIQELPTALGYMPSADVRTEIRANESAEEFNIIKVLLANRSPDLADSTAVTAKVVSPMASCLIACQITDTLKIKDFSEQYPDLVVRRTRRYQKGIQLQAEINLFKKGSEFELARIWNDFAGRPSLIFLPSMQEDGTRLFSKVRMLDRFLIELAAYEYDFVTNMPLLRTKLEAFQSPALQSDEIAIASFETGLPEENAALEKSFLLGPQYNASDSGKLNLGGWYEAIEGINPLAYRGVVPSTHKWVFPYKASPGHALEVSNILLGQFSIQGPLPGRKTKIVPFGNQLLSPALIPAANLAVKHLNGKLRVGSHQSHIFSDQTHCGKAFQKLAASSILIVAAAGNEGLALDKSELCPASMGGHENLLVVGAGGAEGMAGYSNYGSRHVDIAADGKAVASDRVGTSFAAPRVAYLTAQLADSVSEARNAELRAAVMLSAILPAAPLPVRSGGYLNSDLAKLKIAAEALVSLDPAVRKAIGKRIPFASALAVTQSLNDDQALGRLRILIENDALCKAADDSHGCPASDAACVQLASQVKVSCL